MAEAKVTVYSDDRSNTVLNEDTNFIVDHQLPNDEEISFVPDQSNISTHYHKNLLDIPDGNIKGSFEDKLGPHLQETAPELMDDMSNVTVAGTSSEDIKVNYHNQLDESNMNKIKNVESSIIRTSSISFTTNATDIVNSENIAAGFPLNSGNVQLMHTSCSQNSSNISDLFTSATDSSHCNNQEKMNNSLKLICDYGSDSDIDDSIEIHSKPGAIIMRPSENEKLFSIDYRTAQVLFSEDSDDSSDSSDEKSDSDSSTSSSSSSGCSNSNSGSSLGIENASALKRNVTNNEQNKTPKPKKKDPMKTRGEILIEDLPPIKDLQIEVSEKECVELGKIFSIVDQMVVVQSIKNSPALNLDSVLFLDHGRITLGYIFDVFGPVGEPLYCVRFNSAEHIKEKGIKKDMIVYCAPTNEHTSYVFLQDLLSMKGSDASWEDNNEPPPKCLDYSDDEEERTAKRSIKVGERKVTDEGSEQPRKKNGSSFEKRMNERNLRMTALLANKPAAVAIRNRDNNNSNNSNNNSPCPQPPNSAWWTAPFPPSPRFQHGLNRPPPPPFTPVPPRLIQPPTFTLPPPVAPPFFPPIQPPSFSPYNPIFSPSVPPFDPNRPPPPFGFPRSMPPQMPYFRPPL
ncbi:H/ACA ribonucleoprotein complex non-core subunit NAF1 isoform X2 [Zootermopsis nevadensis]|nr:H/ACA ribonucleoprotein complex non-core subunit NAF1 isoform X2 [Zootermopsis nevadensis]